MSRTDRMALALHERALSLPDGGDILVIRAEPGDFLDALDAARLVCEQSFRPVHDALADTYGSRGAHVTPRAEAPAAAAVVNLTRSRAENLGNVARALALLPEGASLAVNGAKTAGIDSLARQIGQALPLEGAFVKAHGRVVWLRRPGALPPEVAHWAEAAAPRRNAEGLLTAPGMFSPETPDAGSARLAASLDARLKGRVAELGAGWGWLARRALETCPGIERLDLYEAEAMALDAARANLADPRVDFHWCDAARLGPGVPPYDAVITNPPFHQGRAAEPDLGAAFITAAARILKPSGRLLMVANRQLPYEAVLDAAFRHWERLSDHGGYKVIEAQRPRRDRG